MSNPYVHPGPKRIAAALMLAGFDNSRQLPPKGNNPRTYGTEVRTMLGIVYGESSGNALELGKNMNSSGVVLSTDFGMTQINDLYEGDLLIKTISPYGSYTNAELRRKFGGDSRNTFWAYQQITYRTWASHIDNAKMARVVYTKSTAGGGGFYPWIAYWNRSGGFSALDDPDRVDWTAIDRGLADLNTELGLGYSLERIASVYLEGLTADPRKALTR